jgi:hypothetical protein
MTNRLAVIVALLLVAGCGGDGDRVRESCDRIMTATCDTLVRCHGTIYGVTFTPAVCDSVKADLIDECVAEAKETIKAASDATVDGCVSGYENFSCDNLCNQAPLDPPACQSLITSPSDTYVTCE